jgi:hypothetical protein
VFPWQDEIACFMLNPTRNLQPDGQNPLDLLVVAPTMTDLDKDGGGDFYARRPKGSLDTSGDYFIWTTNMAGPGHRLDMFIVKVPKGALINAQH